MLHSDFCAIPRGDGTNPGRRLVDAVAAGCIPLLLGDTIRPPLSSLLRYADFSVRVPEAEFLRYPKAAVTDALSAATPRLAELRRNLIRARDELLLGYVAQLVQPAPRRRCAALPTPRAKPVLR